MAVGGTVSKTQLDAELQRVCGTIYINMGIAAELRDFIQNLSDADLTGMGYTVAEITVIRDVGQDLNKLAKIFRGADALPNTKAFDASFKRVTGMCVVNGKVPG